MRTADVWFASWQWFPRQVGPHLGAYMCAEYALEQVPQSGSCGLVWLQHHECAEFSQNSSGLRLPQVPEVRSWCGVGFMGQGLPGQRNPGWASGPDLTWARPVKPCAAQPHFVHNSALRCVQHCYIPPSLNLFPRACLCRWPGWVWVAASQ